MNKARATTAVQKQTTAITNTVRLPLGLKERSKMLLYARGFYTAYNKEDSCTAT